MGSEGLLVNSPLWFKSQTVLAAMLGCVHRISSEGHTGNQATGSGGRGVGGDVLHVLGHYVSNNILGVRYISVDKIGITYISLHCLNFSMYVFPFQNKNNHLIMK